MPRSRRAPPPSAGSLSRCSGSLGRFWLWSAIRVGPRRGVRGDQFADPDHVREVTRPHGLKGNQPIDAASRNLLRLPPVHGEGLLHQDVLARGERQQCVLVVERVRRGDVDKRRRRGRSRVLRSCRAPGAAGIWREFACRGQIAGAHRLDREAVFHQVRCLQPAISPVPRIPQRTETAGGGGVGAVGGAGRGGL